MNRLIKFRVWNGAKWCGTIKPGEIISPCQYGFSEDLIFQQFTGLKDKNDKEIYEGDIVKGIDLNEGPIAAAAIIFDTCGIMYCEEYTENWHEKRCYCLDQCYTEVIGNVFETPELLK